MYNRKAGTTGATTPTTYTYQLLGAPVDGSVVSAVAWRAVTIAFIITTVALIGICAASLWFGIDAEHRQNVQDGVVDALALDLSNTEAALQAEIVAINATLSADIALLAAALNLTNFNGATFIEQIESELANAVLTLDAAIALRMISVNGVDGDNATHNIDLLADPGISIVPDPDSNTITLGNTGCLTLTAGNPGLGFSAATGNIVASNLGVLTLSGVALPNLAGNIDVLGVGMLSVYGDANSSSLTVDASLIVTAITNLQTQTTTQQGEIVDLQGNITTIEQQITDIQMAEYTLAQALNGTVITVNMTLTDLLASVMQLQADVAALQAAEQNETETAVPTGAMFPWTGAVDTTPPGYLLCDGTEYVASDWPALYAVIGSMYCEANCSVGSFRVPDMRARVPAGRGGSGALNAAIGTQVGSETQTLATPNLPSHTHAASSNLGGSHSHTASSARIGDLYQLIDAGDNSGATFSSFGPVNTLTNGFNTCDKPSLAINSCGGTAHYPNTPVPYFQPLTGTASAEAGRSWGEHSHGTTTDGLHNHVLNIANTGSGTAFSVLDASLVVQYIIKT